MRRAVGVSVRQLGHGPRDVSWFLGGVHQAYVYDTLSTYEGQ